MSRDDDNDDNDDNDDIKFTGRGIGAFISWPTVMRWLWRIIIFIYALLLPLHMWWNHVTQARQDRHLERIDRVLECTASKDCTGQAPKK